MRHCVTISRTLPVGIAQQRSDGKGVAGGSDPPDHHTCRLQPQRSTARHDAQSTPRVGSTSAQL